MTAHPEYDPAEDGRRGYFDACRHIRRAKLIAGIYEPIDDDERAIVEAAQREEP
jgi:hypothetical protein